MKKITAAPGQALSADALNRVMREVVRQGNIQVTPPLEVVNQGGGILLRLAQPLQVAIIECGDWIYHPVPNANLYAASVKSLRTGDFSWQDLDENVYLTEANNSGLNPGVRYIGLRNDDFEDTANSIPKRPLWVTVLDSPEGSSGASETSGSGVCVVTDTSCASGGLQVERRTLRGHVVIGGRRYAVTFDTSEDCGSGS